jgi:hypothetical protein
MEKLVNEAAIFAGRKKKKAVERIACSIGESEEQTEFKISCASKYSLCAKAVMPSVNFSFTLWAIMFTLNIKSNKNLFIINIKCNRKGKS